MSSKTGKPRKKSATKRRNSPIRPKAKVAKLTQGSADDLEHRFKGAEDNAVAGEESGQNSPENTKRRGIRLQKLLADRGYGSRRKMEGWIKEGRIEINGRTAQLGQRAVLKDKIKVNGRSLREKVALSKTKVLMYHKPEGEICTVDDPRRRPTVFRNLPKIRGARWVAIGRLDINTSGLLLFTTNGDLANRLMHPSSGIEREYRCRVFGNIDREIIQQLLTGIEIDQHLMQFGRVHVENIDGDQRNKWVHVTLSEGRNREVRKLWDAVGCQVSRLSRVRYGFLTLQRNFRQGEFRELTPKETKRLIETGSD